MLLLWTTQIFYSGFDEVIAFYGNCGTLNKIYITNCFYLFFNSALTPITVNSLDAHLTICSFGRVGVAGGGVSGSPLAGAG